MITSLLERRDCLKLRLLCKCMSARLCDVLWRDLKICEINYAAIREMVWKNPKLIKNTKRLCIVGDIKKGSVKAIQEFCNLLRPKYLVLDSNITEYPSFYKNSRFFESVQVLHTFDDNFRWIYLEMLPSLVEIHSNRQSEDGILARIKDCPNVRNIIFKDSNIQLKSFELKDLVFGDDEVEEAVRSKFAFKFIKEFRTYNLMISCDELAFDLSPFAALFYPNLTHLEMRDFAFFSDFGFLSELLFLTHFTIETNELHCLDTLKPANKLRYCSITAQTLTINEPINTISIPELKIECQTFNTSMELSEFPNSSRFLLRTPKFAIQKEDKNYYYHVDKAWTKSSKAMTSLLLSKHTSKLC